MLSFHVLIVSIHIGSSSYKNQAFKLRIIKGKKLSKEYYSSKSDEDTSK